MAAVNPNTNKYTYWHPAGSGYRDSSNNPYLDAINDILVMHGNGEAGGSDWSTITFPTSPPDFRTVVRKNSDTGETRIYVYDGSEWIAIGSSAGKSNTQKKWMPLIPIHDQSINSDGRITIGSSTYIRLQLPEIGNLKLTRLRVITSADATAQVLNNIHLYTINADSEGGAATITLQQSSGALYDGLRYFDHTDIDISNYEDVYYLLDLAAVSNSKFVSAAVEYYHI